MPPKKAAATTTKANIPTNNDKTSAPKRARATSQRDKAAIRKTKLNDATAKKRRIITGGGSASDRL